MRSPMECAARERDRHIIEQYEKEREKELEKAEFEEQQEYKEFLRWKKLQPKRAKRWRNVKKNVGAGK